MRIGIVFGFAFFFAIPSVSAFSVSPALVEVSLDKGESKNGTISITSTEDHDVSYEVSFQNFVAKGEDGQQDFVANNTVYQDIDWITPQINNFTIEKGGSIDIPYVVTVPKDARPGGHFVAMFVSQKKSDVQIGTGASVRSQIGVLFLIRANGEIKESLDIESFRVVQSENAFNRLPVVFETRFKNLGNVHLKPIGDIVIENAFGRTSAVIPLNPRGSFVLTNSVRRMESIWGNNVEGGGVVSGGLINELVSEWRNFAIGPYTARIVGYYGDLKQPISEQIRFWVFPWHLFLAAILLLSVLIAFKEIYSRLLIKLALIRSCRNTKH